MVRGSDPGGSDVFHTWGPPSLLYNGYRVFLGGKERPGRDADPSPPSSAMFKKGSSYTSTPPMGRTYGLYRATVFVQGCTLPELCHSYIHCHPYPFQLYLLAVVLLSTLYNLGY